MDFGPAARGLPYLVASQWGVVQHAGSSRRPLQQFVDAMRTDGPLRDLPSVDRFCRQNGGAITGGRPELVVSGREMGDYRCCLGVPPQPQGIPVPSFTV